VTWSIERPGHQRIDAHIQLNIFNHQLCLFRMHKSQVYPTRPKAWNARSKRSQEQERNRVENLRSPSDRFVPKNPPASILQTICAAKCATGRSIAFPPTMQEVALSARHVHLCSLIKDLDSLGCPWCRFCARFHSGICSPSPGPDDGRVWRVG
jgi:hypothetical protein